MKHLFFAIALCAAIDVHAAPILETSDFINDANRTGFNGFELITTDSFSNFNGGVGYAEDSILVTQINDDPGNDISTNTLFTGFEGSRAWYPNGGDNGYTEITLVGGGDFFDIGFFVNSGSGADIPVLYEVLDDGNVVLSGATPAIDNFGVNYIGFSGGGFDTIRLRDTVGDNGGIGGSVTDGTTQALAIDSIEIFDGSAAVPEPSTWALMTVAGLRLGGYHWRRRRHAKQ